MLPSDLLFEYDSAELRESARLGMMKLALIIDRNPNLYCWIEGHTDLFGADAYNQNLSKRRAAAVKDYLTGTLHLQDDKIATRGFGSTVPLVKTGSVEEQAPNRRVEIRMRRTPPPAGEPVVVKPKPAPPAPPEEKPVLVKPMRALPVEDPPAPTGENAPRARPVETEPAPPKAQPIEEDPPRATEIEEPALRAVPVE
nr:OmpA family protein [Luteolibacter marinus]